MSPAMQNGMSEVMKLTLHIKFERNRLSSLQDVFLKIASVSLPFSSSHCFTKVILSQSKTPFWHTYKALCGLSYFA